MPSYEYMERITENILDGWRLRGYSESALSVWYLKVKWMFI